MPLKTHLDEQPSLNMTPMIDIVFLLIIFFMVGTKFTELERKISLEVPQVSNVSALTPAPDKRVVNVYRDGRVALDRKVVSLEELQRRLKEGVGQYRDLGVIVRGDAQVPFENVAAVLNTIRLAGVDQMGVSVRMARKRR